MDSEELQRYYYVTALARDDVETCGRLPDYDPTMVIVITWDAMEPITGANVDEVRLETIDSYAIKHSCTQWLMSLSIEVLWVRHCDIS